MFLRECLLRNVGEAKMHVIYELTKLGYPAMYMKFENNVDGSNVVCEGQTWHCTDSDNKPHCIDCGENIALFLAIAAFRDDKPDYQWFVWDDNWVDNRFKQYIPGEPWDDWWWFEVHKATPAELIEYFNGKN